MIRAVYFGAIRAKQIIDRSIDRSIVAQVAHQCPLPSFHSFTAAIQKRINSTHVFNVIVL